ncbi:hypothetical protein ACFYPN_32585 [Streptomyces sp. NPDC005576]|uniref:hypothetical protein n=1 Tax=Streptomyces sp. NPDC005576 TaxID=3364726 RepID=UPI0036D01260
MTTTPQTQQPAVVSAAPVPPVPPALGIPSGVKAAFVCLAAAVAVIAAVFVGFIVLVRPGAAGPLNTMLAFGAFVVATAALVVTCVRTRQ